MRIRLKLFLLWPIALVLSACAMCVPESGGDSVQFARTDFVPSSGDARHIVFISDLHLGLGRNSLTDWNPTEDFRWPKALDGFLREISTIGQHKVDLVIFGDFLELWQPTAHIKCKGVTADFGCTIPEMQEIVGAVVKAHPDALTSLRNLSQDGDNRLHIVPGNHDSALLLKPIWQPVGDALQADRGRLNLVTRGIWVSPDGGVVAEHGHQIGSDVNRYDHWPNITRRRKTRSYITRPWGKYFVQNIFNEVEGEEYAIIDNISPETAGAPP